MVKRQHVKEFISPTKAGRVPADPSRRISLSVFILLAVRLCL